MTSRKQKKKFSLKTTGTARQNCHNSKDFGTSRAASNLLGKRKRQVESRSNESHNSTESMDIDMDIIYVIPGDIPDLTSLIVGDNELYSHSFSKKYLTFFEENLCEGREKRKL
ncbi:hypothetical protein VNO78_21386 [Psophocarpus tetragonolobus]|uniref:Uncharacterized protein n=1 Tax=Psophocarpus tetragonolobus TaxID=3891 RepID=A0AAN9SBN0_PSOTE